MFPLFQQTIRPLFSLFLIAVPQQLYLFPHIGPGGQSNILQHNCALFCNETNMVIVWTQVQVLRIKSGIEFDQLMD